MELTKEECVCPDLPKRTVDECPRNKKFSIPSKNAHLQQCILQIFQKSLNAKEKLFWADYLSELFMVEFPFFKHLIY